MARKLTKKQRDFVNKYADTGNGTQAVIDANYNVKNENSAHVIAYENLQKPKILEELKKLGFDSNNAKRVVAEILNKEGAQDRDRLNAADKIFKVNSDYAPEKHVNLNIDAELNDAEQALAAQLLHAQSDKASDTISAEFVGGNTQ